MTKFLWIFAIGAALTLSAAAVWMGGLNQDEGWYLYAANLVSEGQLPYRDFFYTQGPVMPIVYSAFTALWRNFGLLGARVFTVAIGLLGIVLAALLARRLAPNGRGNDAALVTFVLLGANLYHLYYNAIPKTYALAGLLVIGGFYLLAKSRDFAAGIAFAFASGTRVSLGLLLVVVGLWLLCRRDWRRLVPFAAGGFIALAIAYGPFLANADAFAGLVAAQQYHAARGGSDVVWTVGSFSRLVRWYLPVFVALVLGGRAVFGPQLRLLVVAFAAVFAVQMLAPFPYEDYQVPIMALLAVAGAVALVGREDLRRSTPALLAVALTFGVSFGSPLLEKWSVNGQDRFWSLKKSAYELPQLREVARKIEAADPGGKRLFTQDLYLAIETGRKVPKGLEMGPFAIMDDSRWRRLISSAEAPVAALSGYTFAIEPPKCDERSITRQMDYWHLVKERYALVEEIPAFGQNSTPLLLLKRK